jgi:hypothetical protein
VQAALAAARRLQDDQHVLAVPDVTAQQRRQGGVGFQSVGKTPVALARQTVGIEMFGRCIDADAGQGARHGELILVCGVRLKAGGGQLCEERREGSGRASCYDPVLNLGRITMSRHRDTRVPAGIPAPPSRQHQYTALK